MKKKDNKKKSRDSKKMKDAVHMLLMHAPPGYVPCPYKSIVVNPEICRLNSSYPDRVILGTGKSSEFAMENCVKCKRWRRHVPPERRWPVEKKRRLRSLVIPKKFTRTKAEEIIKKCVKEKVVKKNKREYHYYPKHGRMFTFTWSIIPYNW